MIALFSLPTSLNLPLSLGRPGRPGRRWNNVLLTLGDGQWVGTGGELGCSWQTPHGQKRGWWGREKRHSEKVSWECPVMVFLEEGLGHGHGTSPREA